MCMGTSMSFVTQVGYWASQQQCGIFSDFIFSHDLLDSIMEGSSTRSNNQENKSFSRIDIFLEDYFPNMVQQRLPYFLSNHFPILLVCGELQREKNLFRFKNLWLRARGFTQKAKTW